VEESTNRSRHAFFWLVSVFVVVVVLGLVQLLEALPNKECSPRDDDNDDAIYFFLRSSISFIRSKNNSIIRLSSLSAPPRNITAALVAVSLDLVDQRVGGRSRRWPCVKLGGPGGAAAHGMVLATSMGHNYTPG